MASWRRKVLALFPDLRIEAQRPSYNPYSAFFDLLPRVRKAHLADDHDMLCRIYGFAQWCFDQPNPELWNPAGVCFYEHLFDSHPKLWPEIVRWLSPKVFRGCWSLWEFQLSAQNLAEVKRVYSARREPIHTQIGLKRHSS